MDCPICEVPFEDLLGMLICPECGEEGKPGFVPPPDCPACKGAEPHGKQAGECITCGRFIDAAEPEPEQESPWKVAEGSGQMDLLEVKDIYEEAMEGLDLPEYISNQQKEDSKITVRFGSKEDREEFMRLCGENPERRESMWFPPREKMANSVKHAPPSPEPVPANEHPVYIISKGRWENPMTARRLKKLGIPFRIAVEPQEVDKYLAAGITQDEVLELPFSNLGQGSIPARNFVWEHSKELGAKRHWILDDNLNGFYRLNRNTKKVVTDENPFTACEKIADAHTNVPMAGLNYEFFVPRQEKRPPFNLNTRVYSCILLSNEICPEEHYWRGKYNEDTDLSLRFLKRGFCTILLNMFLAKKVTTMVMKGGNTDELYADDGRLKMAESLVDQHPDVARVSQKWGRVQHHVDYAPFSKNKLIRKP